MEPIGNKLISMPALNRNKIIIKYRSNFITYKDPLITDDLKHIINPTPILHMFILHTIHHLLNVYILMHIFLYNFQI